MVRELEWRLSTSKRRPPHASASPEELTLVSAGNDAESLVSDVSQLEMLVPPAPASPPSALSTQAGAGAGEGLFPSLTPRMPPPPKVNRYINREKTELFNKDTQDDRYGITKWGNPKNDVMRNGVEPDNDVSTSSYPRDCNSHLSLPSIASSATSSLVACRHLDEELENRTKLKFGQFPSKAKMNTSWRTNVGYPYGSSFPQLPPISKKRRMISSKQDHGM